MNYPIHPCGDRAVTIRIGNTISEQVNRDVVSVLQSIQLAKILGIQELVPTYTSICVHYDPEVLDFDELLKKLNQLEVDTALVNPSKTSRIVEVPVCYGGEYGPDLTFVATYNHLTPDEVVNRHTEGSYLVYMLGFLPGFAYMGGMDETIACPRLTSPRTKIPAGSVGIAGSQTGIYPLASPGGWQLIGRTPLNIFQMQDGHAQFLLTAGDRVRFIPITAEQFLEMEGRV